MEPDTSHPASLPSAPANAETPEPPCSFCGAAASSSPFAYRDARGGADALAICSACMELIAQPGLRKMLRVMIQNYQVARATGFVPANADNERILDRHGQKIKKAYGA